MRPQNPHKRPRPSSCQNSLQPASTSNTTSPMGLGENSQVLALLSQLATGGNGNGMEDEGRRLLLPAIRGLAQFYHQQQQQQQYQSTSTFHLSPIPTPSPLPLPETVSSSTTLLPPVQPQPQPPPQKKKKSTSVVTAAPTLPPPTASTVSGGERFPPIKKTNSYNTLTTKGNLNPVDNDSGCFNCKRKKSQVWREGVGDKVEEGRIVVCNGLCHFTLFSNEN